MYKSQTPEEKRLYYLKNKEYILARSKSFYESNKEKIRKKQREYYLRDKKRRWAYQKNKKQTEPEYRLACNLRNRLRGVLRQQGSISKKSKTYEYVGCSKIQLKTHLESLFSEGMTWNNYGEWHVDHIQPLSKFNLLSEEGIHKAMHYTNLQPLWAYDNIIKSNKSIIDNANTDYHHTT